MDWSWRIEFRSEAFDDEDMHLFTANLPDNYINNITPECNEGTLAWIDEDDIMKLNLWEGDRIFLQKLIANEEDINLRLKYDANGKLVASRETKP